MLYYARLRENSLTTTPGALAIYATTGAANDSPDMRTYVGAYRAHHLGMKRLALAADCHQREFAVPWQCLAGAQRTRIATLCPWLTEPAPAPMIRAAEQLLVRQAAYGGNSPASVFFSCDDATPATAIAVSRRPHFAPGPVLKFADDDFYAADYMREQVSVLRQVGGLVGKFPILYHSTDLTLHLRPRGRASMVRSKHVAGSTLTFERDLWTKFRFDPALTLGEDRDFVLRIQAAGHPVTATTIFNHVAIRHGDSHTWPAADRELFAPEMAEPIGTCAAADRWPAWIGWIPGS